jgi:hypothetical protein
MADRREIIELTLYTDIIYLIFLFSSPALMVAERASSINHVNKQPGTDHGFHGLDRERIKGTDLFSTDKPGVGMSNCFLDSFSP